MRKHRSRYHLISAGAVAVIFLYTTDGMLHKFGLEAMWWHGLIPISFALVFGIAWIWVGNRALALDNQ